MRSAWMKVAAATGLFLAVAVAAVLTFIYSGAYDISATTPHFSVTHKVLRTVMEQSVKRQARGVAVPELDDPVKVHGGFRSFNAMCVTCHGAPGAPASEINKGLYPRAPDLAEAAKAWTPAELYVIVKRGIKMSGMPAFEPTHSGDQLWELVAFLKVLRVMPSAEYQGAVEYVAKSKGGDSHDMKAGSH